MGYSIAKPIHPTIKAWFNIHLCQVPFQVMGNENAQDSGLEELTIHVDHIPTGNRTWHKISKERSSLQLWYTKWISWWDQWWRLGTLVQEWQICLLYSCVTYTHLVMAVWNTDENGSEQTFRWWERIWWLISDVCYKWSVRKWLHMFAFSGAMKRQWAYR